MWLFCGLFVVCRVSLFFFFKQKTAYEMRIGDWSSDVCSSDLGERAAAGFALRSPDGRHATSLPTGILASATRWRPYGGPSQVSTTPGPLRGVRDYVEDRKSVV